MSCLASTSPGCLHLSPRWRRMPSRPSSCCLRCRFCRITTSGNGGDGFIAPTLSRQLSCVLGIGVFLLALYRDGQLPGYIEFHRDLKTLSLIAAVPADMTGWLMLSARSNSLMIVSLLLLLIWGGWLILWYWKKPEQWLGVYLFVFGCLSVALYSRYLVRPHMTCQLLVVPAVGLFLYFTALIPAFSSSAAQRFLLRTCGVFIVAALYFSPVGNLASVLAQRLYALPQNIRALSVDADVISEAEAKFYAPNTFTQISPRAPEIYNYFQNLKKTVDDQFDLRVGE